MAARPFAALVPIVLGSLIWASPVLALGEGQNGFPNWAERVVLEWMNRARCDPQVEMTQCGAACGEAACYTPQPPLPYDLNLNRSARFHSDEMQQQNYFAHNSICTVVPGINGTYPGSCNAAASCACVGGTATCNPGCTTWDQRISLFGGSPAGEIIASDPDPNGSFYLWLYETNASTACAYSGANGHRWQILTSPGPVGTGMSGLATGDFSSGGTPPGKLASGSHYPQQAASVDVWASWYDAAGPSLALVDVDGTCSPLALMRGAVTNGAYTASVGGVGSGCHRYYFLFKDSNGVEVDYPTTGSLGIGTTGCADWDSTRPAAGMGCSCTPVCTGKMCGDDGCGGSCGTCGAGTTCQAGLCVAGPPDSGPPPDGGGGIDAGKNDAGKNDAGNGGPGPDGGSPGGDAGPGGGVDGGLPGGGGDGGDNGAAPSGDTSGCSCRVGPGEGGVLALGSAAFVLGLVVARRKRRR